jgi:cobalamin biosynthesis Mg chelatase CobN
MVKQITLIIFASLLISCGSKKKAVDKLETQTKIEVSKDIETKTKEVVKVLQVDKQTNDDFTGEVADVSQPATITKQGNKTTFTNFKHVKTAAKIADTQTDTKQEITQQIEDKTVTTASVEVKAKSKDVEIKKGFPWWILIVVAALVFIVHNHLKSWKILSFFR